MMFIFIHTYSKSVMNSPWAFLALMAFNLVVIITVWLIACGLLLQIPLLTNPVFDTLGFIFGFVWGFFASSWALLVLMQPSLTSYASFCHTLQVHLLNAPVLYTLHCLLFSALSLWGYWLYKGMIARTTGHIKTLIQIGIVLFLIVFVLIIIALLFGDVIVTRCQSIINTGG